MGAAQTDPKRNCEGMADTVEVGSGNKLVVGTRGSLLARAQTDWVVAELRAAHPDLDVDVTVIRTTGDRQQGRPLPEVGGKGLFTLELEQALRDGSIDLAVHSAKDLPTELGEGLAIVAVPAREDARDAFISRAGARLDDLPEGAVIGTSSLRRKAQLLIRRPDLRFTTLRGNIDTRLKKVKRGDCDATILAMAGLNRTSLTDAVTEPLEFDVMVPAPGQGALAIEGRDDDERLGERLTALHDAETASALTCERRLLELLEAGCLAPLGAHARMVDTNLQIEAVVAMPDGSRAVRASERGSSEDGSQTAERLAARLLEDGAGDIIAACRPDT